jgi:hypothetical protein
MKALELTGQKFGRLVVENKNPIRSLDGSIRWDCICECGKKVSVIGSNLVSENTTSCGCYNREIINKVNSTHGMSHTPEYYIWKAMNQRCTNSNTKNYSDYGGRGITVCERWLDSFEAFYEDMGPRPSPDHSIERRENDGNYEKSNCYWATRTEQNNNKRNNTLYSYKGQEYSIKQLANLPEAKVSGACISTLKNRINQSGYSIEKALNEQVIIGVRSRLLHTHNGVTKTIKEWSKEYGIEYYKLYYRLVQVKWDFERAVNTP